MQKSVYVAPRGSIWEVRLEGREVPESLHKTKDSAFESARSTARKEHTTFVILYSQDGEMVGSELHKQG